MITNLNGRVVPVNVKSIPGVGGYTLAFSGNKTGSGVYLVMITDKNTISLTTQKIEY